jgi:hypothetical protein
MENLKQWYATSSLQITLQAVLSLKGEGERDGVFTDERENTLLLELIKAKNYTILYWFYTARAIVRYMFHQDEESIADARQAEAYVNNAVGLISVGEHYFYLSLALLSSTRPPGARRGEEEAAIVEDNQKKLLLWSAHAPCNYAHKYTLVYFTWPYMRLLS